MVSVLMVVKSDVARDARVLREAAALVEAGYEVTIIGDADPGVQIGLEGVQVHFVATGGDSRGPRPWWQRPVRWLLLPEHRSRAEATFRRRAEAVGATLPPVDIVFAHDFSALEACRSLADRWNARLVYDSHEWWRGRARFGRPEPLRRWRQARKEQGLVAEADLVVTVSSELAALFKRYVDVEPVVVRNTFEPRATNAPAVPSGVVYAGRVAGGRDLETLIAATPDLPVELIVMGASDGSLDLGDAARLVEQGTISDVDDAFATGGIVAVPLVRGPKNHDVALPNKVFHAVACGVPVVAADLPALRSLIQETGIGVLYTPGDSASFVTAVAKIVADYAHFRDRVADQQTPLSWSHDKAVLTEAVDKLVSTGRGQ